MLGVEHCKASVLQHIELVHRYLSSEREPDFEFLSVHSTFIYQFSELLEAALLHEPAEPLATSQLPKLTTTAKCAEYLRDRSRELLALANSSEPIDYRTILIVAGKMLWASEHAKKLIARPKTALKFGHNGGSTKPIGTS
jgi:hypothetical protein